MAKLIIEIENGKVETTITLLGKEYKKNYDYIEDEKTRNLKKQIKESLVDDEDILETIENIESAYLEKNLAEEIVWLNQLEYLNSGQEFFPDTEKN